MLTTNASAHSNTFTVTLPPKPLNPMLPSGDTHRNANFDNWGFFLLSDWVSSAFSL
jgi:hypothetical protein